MKIHKELKPYGVIKTFHIFNAKTIAEISQYYSIYVWSESDEDIRPGVKLATSKAIHICEKPWEDEEIIINKTQTAA